MMITVTDAKNIIYAKAKKLAPVSVPLIEAAGYVAAEDIYSPMSMPGFAQSSMDGYAILLNNINQLLRIQDELPAGSQKQIYVQEGAAVKVFTGGPVPANADMVIQKEWVAEINGQIQIIQQSSELGLHIRQPGSSIQKGDLVIQAETLFHPYQLAMLASLGFTEVLVYPMPKIGLVITGNELIKPGQALDIAQVYESNSIGLVSAFKSLSVNDVTVYYAKDDLNDTISVVKHAINQADILVLTGGVSVGDYDFVAKACTSIGAEQLLHGIKQKPGKPMYVGEYYSKLIFGLPGNPSSVLHCFQQYVKPTIELMVGKVPIQPIQASLKADYTKAVGLTHFLKGLLVDDTVSILPAQASYQVGAFSNANCWVELPADTAQFVQGQMVTVHLF